MAAVKSRLAPDAFAKATKRSGTGTCLLVALFKTLSAADVKAIHTAFADLSIHHAAIHRVLTDLGFPGSINVIRRHRDYGCRHCGIPACR